jgi:hypothetical protein
MIKFAKPAMPLARIFNKFLMAICCFTFFSNTASAQKTQKFVLDLPVTKTSNSLYHKITLLDQRPDTTNLGMVFKGIFNKTGNVVAPGSLQAQLDRLLINLTGNTAQPQELLLQVQRLRFMEIRNSFPEIGYFYLKANLFVYDGNSYKKLITIDTIVIKKAIVDVTGEILKAGKKTVSGFISAGIIRAPVPALVKSYSFAEIINEGKSIKTYPNGLYTTYQSFVDQKPDYQIVFEDGEMQKNKVLYIIDAKGELKPAYINKMTLLVHNNQLYLAKPSSGNVTPSDFYQIDNVTEKVFSTLPVGKPMSTGAKTLQTLGTAYVIALGVSAVIIGTLIAIKGGERFD